MTQTRAQQRLQLAVSCVGQVTSESAKTKNVYQGLCHSFPVFVLSGGLAQALAFTESKAGQGEGIPKAHQLLRSHIATILDKTPDQVMESVRTESIEEYLYLTREILEAMVFFKRFAEALLRPEEGSVEA